MLRILRILAFVGMLVTATIASISVLANGCESISFDAHGRRATTIQCYFDQSGALPAVPTALAVLAAVFAVIALLYRTVRRAKHQQLTGVRGEAESDSRRGSPRQVAAKTSSDPRRAESRDSALAERLETLIDLHTRGLLSDEELAERKKALLDEI